MGNVAITDELRSALEKQCIVFYPLKTATPQEFFDAIGNAKHVNAHGAFVTQHSVSDYERMRLFVTEDSTAGIAIADDGNILSIFNGGEKHGVLKTLLPIAIENGGCKLDNYDSPQLSAMYELYGFHPVSKVRFDRRFAPNDWNYDRDGEPDVVFWIHNGDSAQDVVLNFGKYVIPWDCVQEFTSYEEAWEYRDNLLEIINTMETEDETNPSHFS